MNTQIERLENHTARLTVEVEPERLEKAMHGAATKLSRRLNIPGFRKGKAPYKVIVSYVGVPALMEEAVEDLGQEVYKQALTESQLDPYGPGQLEDVKTEETNPVFTYVVPLQPTVELNAYRTIRLPFEQPTVSDDEVKESLRAMQEQQAVVEESQQPVARGNRVTMFIDGRIVGEDVAEAEHDHDHDHEHEGHDHDHDDEAPDEHGHHHHVDDNTILHEHDAQMILDDDSEPIPGFIEALAGANVGDRREFDLTYPDDAKEYEKLAGKQAHFDVEIKKIENITLPELTDDFAALATKDDEKPLTLLELRMRVRENLQKLAEERARNNYSREALDAIVEQANVSYPEAAVADQIQRMLQQFDRDLRQRGLTLDDYLKIYNRTMDDLYNDYHDTAASTVARGLVMRNLMEKEGITLTPADVDAEIDRIISGFGENSGQFRGLFAEPSMRESVENDLLTQRVTDRIVSIAKGEAPELAAATPEPAAEDASASEAPAEATQE